MTSSAPSRVPWKDPAYRSTVAAALAALGIDRLVLAIHDVSFPAGTNDIGSGSPYSDAGRAFFAFVHALGFTGVQLGPQGEQSEVNPSPYDSTLFSRSTLTLDLPRVAGEVIDPASQRYAQHRAAWALQAARLDALFATTSTDEAHRWAEGAGAWMKRDTDYAEREHFFGHGDWRSWPEEMPASTPASLRARARYELAQYLAHRQHEALRASLSPLGLRLYGDLQVGISHRDLFALQHLFLRDYFMGAPASRTTPDGQPWGFPVLDPAQYAHGGADLVGARVDKMLDDYDGLRVDHPHGLVDPWVYRFAHGDDPLRAVREGARLFSSPDLPDHPLLARFAIARPDDLDRAQLRYADHWVKTLDADQVNRYGVLFDRLIAGVKAKGRRLQDVLCEVLSTLPYPVQRVLERDGFGRLIITQKAKPEDPRDVYRIENAKPADWAMVGNHDTPPLWLVVDKWHGTEMGRARAVYLAQLLERDPTRRKALADELAASPSRMATAMFAGILTSKAKSISIFFADLLGMKESYNEPGVVAESNWRLRVPPDYATSYAIALKSEHALDLMKALAMALRAKGADQAIVDRVEAFR